MTEETKMDAEALRQETAEAAPEVAEHDRVAELENQLAEAKQRADSMVGDARTRADTMEREARAKATALDQEAERKHVEVMGSLEEKRSSLERKIEELRTFEREYRTRLRSYLESHLRDLDSRGSAEPASNARQNQHAGA